jgi:hypothetical protein
MKAAMMMGLGMIFGTLDIRTLWVVEWLLVCHSPQINETPKSKHQTPNNAQPSNLMPYREDRWTGPIVGFETGVTH